MKYSGELTPTKRAFLKALAGEGRIAVRARGGYAVLDRRDPTTDDHKRLNGGAVRYQTPFNIQHVLGPTVHCSTTTQVVRALARTGLLRARRLEDVHGAGATWTQMMGGYEITDAGRAALAAVARQIVGAA